MSNYAQLASRYRQAWLQRGRSEESIGLAVFSHLHVDESKSAFADFYPYYSAYLEPLFKEAMPIDQYRHMCSPQGSLFSASTQAVIAAKVAPVVR